MQAVTAGARRRPVASCQHGPREVDADHEPSPSRCEHGQVPTRAGPDVERRASMEAGQTRLYGALLGNHEGVVGVRRVAGCPEAVRRTYVVNYTNARAQQASAFLDQRWYVIRPLKPRCFRPLVANEPLQGSQLVRHAVEFGGVAPGARAS